MNAPTLRIAEILARDHCTQDEIDACVRGFFDRTIPRIASGESDVSDAEDVRAIVRFLMGVVREQINTISDLDACHRRHAEAMDVLLRRARDVADWDAP